MPPHLVMPGLVQDKPGHDDRGSMATGNKDGHEAPIHSSHRLIVSVVTFLLRLSAEA